jgi:D-alanine-D-alanine ligase
MNARTIALVYGRVEPDAPPDEQDNLVQVETVRAACRRLGWQTIDVPLSLDLGVAAAVLRSSAPAMAFNLTETLDGKARLIPLAPSLLDSLALPYTGAPAEAIFTTSHKTLAKRIMTAAGVPTAPWAAGGQAARGELPFPGPYIVKSLWEHASVGMEDSSVAADPAALRAEIARRAPREGIDGMFVESYIEGREFNIALLGGAAGPRGSRGSVQVLPAAEMQFIDYPDGKPRVVGYRAKWVDGSFEAGSTVRRFAFPPADGPLLEQMAGIARACWQLFGLAGWARVDFRVDGEGRPWVLEVNANPCISPDAGFAAAAGEAGLSIDDVVARIIADTGGGPA